jgi:hypothetical protein
MTTAENEALLRRRSDTYETEGWEAALWLIDEVFDPEADFSPLLAREIEGRSYDDVIVLLTRMIGTARGSSVPIGQELGMVYEFHNGRVKRLTAYGSHEEARTAMQVQRA